MPVLLLAVRRGDDAAVDALIQAGADVDIRDPQERTALMHAAEFGRESIVATLLDAGAAPDLFDNAGATALVIAKSWGHSRMQFMLKERFVRPEPVDSRRTRMACVPDTFELRGNPDRFDLWARLIDHAIAELGDDYEVLPEESAERARELAAKLRDRRAPAAPPWRWHVLHVTSSEVGIVRNCLSNVAYGLPMKMPEGLTRTQIRDLFEELEASLRR